MNAKKCDRCGRYYDENQFGYAGSIKYQRPRDATADYELCPSCCQMLQRFLEFKDGGFTRHSEFDHLPKGWHEGCGIGSTMGEIWCDTCFARIVAAEERERKQILGVDVVFLKEDPKE